MWYPPGMECPLVPAIQKMGISNCWSSRHLRNLTAAMKESMRFKPVGPVAIRQAARSDQLKDGSGKVVMEVGKGDGVVINLADMHRDPKVFPVPGEFDPRRNFLENPEVNGSSSDKHQPSSVFFRPFGHGRKGCVGLYLAQVEMTTLLSSWLATFHTTSVQGRSHAPRSVCDETPLLCMSLCFIDLRHHHGVQNWRRSKLSSSSQGMILLLFLHGRNHVLWWRCTQLRGAGDIEASRGGMAARETKWDVASQPTSDIIVAAQLRHPLQVFVCGPHGCGKTTLCDGLKEALATHPANFEFLGEMARSVMKVMTSNEPSSSDPSLVILSLSLCCITS